MFNKLIQRQKYLDEALMFRDKELVKVVTGIRRARKSSLLQLVRNHIEAEGQRNRAFVSLNLENRENNISSAEDLYSYIKRRLKKGGGDLHFY